MTAVAIARRDVWATISQEIPSCASPCLNETLLGSACMPDDMECACSLVLGSPVLGGCAMQSCSIADGLGTINGTATACGVPMRDRGGVLYITTTVLCSVALSCIFLRLLGAPKSQRKWVQVADDSYMVVNAVLLVGMMACTILLHEQNYGRDIWTLTTGQIRTIMILIYNLEIYYTLINMLTKLAILGFYLRFFPFVIFPGLRTAIYATIAITVASGTSFTMTMVFQCTPVRLMWSAFDDVPPVGSCININLYGWIVAAFNFGLDLWLLVLPLPELIKISLPLRKKIVVCLMFTVGSFVTIVSVPRIISMASFKQTTNPTYDLVYVSLWGHVEASVCVILACIPRISVFFMRIYRRYSNRRADNLQSDPSDEHWPGDRLGRRGGAKNRHQVSGPKMAEVVKPNRSSDEKFGREFAGNELYSVGD